MTAGQTASVMRFDRGSVHAGLSVATRAPSILNTQPWQWSGGPSRMFLRADRSRQLAVIDADGLALRLSCGAALQLGVLGLRVAGWTVWVERLPDHDDPDLLAVLHPFDHTEATQRDVERVEASAQRHSDRRPFRADPLPAKMFDRLREVADEPGVYVHFPAHENEKIALAAAFSWADRVEHDEPSYAAELAHWVRADGSHADGVPASAVPHVGTGHPRRSDIALPDYELGRAGKEAIPIDVDEHPLLAIVFTTSDHPRSQLRAGEAMMRLMLEAQLQGLATCAISQAFGVHAFRSRLRALMGWVDHPQTMLRLGTPPAGPASPRVPRRPITDVLHFETDA
jgi:nitroreductase